MKNVVCLEKAIKYSLTKYAVSDGVLEEDGELVINFITNKEDGEPGVSAEQLIYMLVDRLKTVNFDIQDEFTNRAVIDLLGAAKNLNARKWNRRKYTEKLQNERD